MGLNISHGAFDGAYSSFNRFRQFVLRSIGGSYPPHKDNNLDNDFFYFEDSFNIEEHEGLKEFFYHSDCEGNISPEMCKKVADELEQIMSQMKEEAKKDMFGTGHIFRSGGYMAVVENFIKGCRSAHENDEYLEFH